MTPYWSNITENEEIVEAVLTLALIEQSQVCLNILYASCITV